MRRDSVPPPWTRTRAYRIAVAVLFGAIGFAVNFFDIELFSSPQFRVSVLAGLLFPLLIGLAWGWRYGLLSALAGGCQSMWWLWRSDGYGFLYAVPVFTAWVVWHGYWADRRRTGAATQWYQSQFIIEMPFRLASELGFYTVFRWLVRLNPPPWAPSITWTHVPLSWVNTVAIKHTITAYFLLLISYIFLSLGPVRDLLGLERRRADRQIGVIYAMAILTGVIIWGFDSVISYVAFNPTNRTLAEIAVLDVEPYHLFVRNLFVIISLIAGGVVAQYASRRLQLEHALRSESNRLARVMETSPIAISVVAADGRITYANARTESLLGLSRAQINGLAYNDPELQITAPDGGIFPDEQLPFNLVRTTLQPVADVQHAITYPDGQRVLMNINAAPLLDEEGQFDGMIAAMEDITQKQRNQEALVQSEQRYRSVFDTSPLAFVVWDPEARVIDWNRQAEVLFGWKREEVLGRNFLDFLVPESARQQVSEAVASLPTGNFISHAVTEDFTKSGEILLCEWNRAILRNSDDEILCVISLGLDITERRRAEQALRESEQKFHALFDTMREGVAIHEIVYDTSGEAVDYRILDVNTSYERIIEVSKQAAVGGLARDLYDTAPAPFLDIYAEVARTGRHAFFETFHEPLGKHLSISVASPGKDLFATVFDDISDRVRSQRELRMYRQHLEELVAERTAQLEVRTKELEDFSYSVSHDLKAPLRGIDGYSHLLLTDYADRLDEEGIFFLKNVRQAVMRMHELIDDLLAYSRIERRSVQHVEIDIQSLIDAIVHTMGPEIAARQVEITVDLPFRTIHGDLDSLSQSLRNLLDNAIKFTSDTPTPRVVIVGEERDSVQVISVQDNGIGFDMRYHDKIFQIFQRLHRSDDYPGTGVGLAIVRKAMERMGGRAWAESALGEGATFYLEIPKHSYGTSTEGDPYAG